MRKKFSKKTLIVYACIIVFGLGILSLSIYMQLRPTVYQMEVKSTSWISVVEIESLQHIHEEGWDCPSDADDITTSRKEKYIDADGMVFYADYYDYWVNRWRTNRSVVESGQTRQPYFGKYILKEEGNTLGCERVKKMYVQYQVCGVLKGETEIRTIEVPAVIWKDLYAEGKNGDWLKYKKKNFGDTLYDFQICKHGDGIR